VRGLAAAVLLAAAGCSHPAALPADGSAMTDAAGDVPSRDAPGDRPDVAASDAPPDVPPSDAALDLASDAPADAPPPSGSIPCGHSYCDPTSQYCFHITGGLTGESFTCAANPASCGGQPAGCDCLTPDGGPLFCPCKAVTGPDATGWQLDCPGPVG
jgi:hypothetical protein